MSNLATVLKDEMSRVARKQLRVDAGSTKKLVSQHRGNIADLRRRVAALEKEIRAFRKLSKHLLQLRSKVEPATPVRHRFRPEFVSAHRRKVGLSAEAYARLLNVTGQAVRNWEAGTRPRDSQLDALAELRRLGKREIAARLQADAPQPRVRRA